MTKFFMALLFLILNQQIIYAADVPVSDRDWKKTFSQISNADKITTLARECPYKTPSECADDLYQKVWLHLEADNGQQFRLDLNSVMDGTAGGKVAVVYIASPSMMLDMSRIHRLVFDCHGSFIDLTHGITNNVMDAPPKSVVGKIEKIICRVPIPQEYCVGLSKNECRVVTQTVNSGNRPDYCKQGYGLVNSGLNNEQRRVCDVMGVWK